MQSPTQCSIRELLVQNWVILQPKQNVGTDDDDDDDDDGDESELGH